MAYLQQPWSSGVLTHNGPLVQRLERELSAKLGTSDFITVCNGTLALQMAIKALKLKGEIITTPFTWVATVSAIKWEGCTPIFADIDPYTFNIDPEAIRRKITPNTVAIMPVHVFGNPCQCDEIEAIASERGLKVIYDAAHAVGTTYKGQSVLNCGDISATSLHATKIFNTGEGGGCITGDPSLNAKLKRIRFFGHDDSKDVVEDGFNGKMTEIHAALGLANLNYFNEVLADRKQKWLAYQEMLSAVAGLSFQKLSTDGESNYSYFPVVFDSEKRLLKVLEALNAKGIFPRRYFYPAVNGYEKIVSSASCPQSESLSSRVLCLPLYWKLQHVEVVRIARIILR